MQSGLAWDKVLLSRSSTSLRFVTRRVPKRPRRRRPRRQAAVSSIVEGLVSVLVTLQVVPIIRCPRGGAAEHVAAALEGRLRDLLKGRSNLFSEQPAGGGAGAGGGGGGALAATLSRPLLVLFDRNFDLSVMLQHTWSYKPLVQVRAWSRRRHGMSGFGDALAVQQAVAQLRWLHGVFSGVGTGGASANAAPGETAARSDAGGLRSSATCEHSRAAEHGPQRQRRPPVKPPVNRRSTVGQPQDVLGLRLNRVTLGSGEPAAAAGAGAPAAPLQQSKKGYDVDEKDFFWEACGSMPFPRVRWFWGETQGIYCVCMLCVWGALPRRRCGGRSPGPDLPSPCIT
jgi:hypothetical protein